MEQTLILLKLHNSESLQLITFHCIKSPQYRKKDVN